MLLLINSSLAYYEESQAGNAVAALTKSLAARANVLRDGQWSLIDAAELVPGDIVELNLGDIVPAGMSIKHVRRLSRFSILFRIQMQPFSRAKTATSKLTRPH